MTQPSTMTKALLTVTIFSFTVTPSTFADTERRRKSENATVQWVSNNKALTVTILAATALVARGLYHGYQTEGTLNNRFDGAIDGIKGDCDLIRNTLVEGSTTVKDTVIDGTNKTANFVTTNVSAAWARLVGLFDNLFGKAEDASDAGEAPAEAPVQEVVAASAVDAIAPAAEKAVAAVAYATENDNPLNVAAE